MSYQTEKMSNKNFIKISKKKCIFSPDRALDKTTPTRFDKFQKIFTIFLIKNIFFKITFVQTGTMKLYKSSAQNFAKFKKIKPWVNDLEKSCVGGTRLYKIFMKFFCFG